MIVTVLANVALVGHDVRFDFTRERVFTPSRQALEVVDRLRQDVVLTYFYHAQDQNSKRLKELLTVLGRRNPRLAQMLAKLGVLCTQSVIIDPQQHYTTDPEMVAVSGLEPHPITTNVSLTF